MRHRCPVEGKISAVLLTGKLIEASCLSSTILDLHSEVPHPVNSLFWEPKTVFSVISQGTKYFTGFCMFSLSSLVISTQAMHSGTDWAGWTEITPLQNMSLVHSHRKWRDKEWNWVLVSHILNGLLNHWAIKEEPDWGLCWLKSSRYSVKVSTNWDQEEETVCGYVRYKNRTKNLWVLPRQRHFCTCLSEPYSENTYEQRVLGVM